MDILRTPDDRFAGLPGFPFEPHYVEVDDGVGRSVHEGAGALRIREHELIDRVAARVAIVEALLRGMHGGLPAPERVLQRCSPRRIGDPLPVGGQGRRVEITI